MRARGTLAVFLPILTIVVLTAMPTPADAGMDFSPSRFFAAAKAKIKNALSRVSGGANAKKDQQRAATTRADTKPPARPAPQLAGIEQGNGDPGRVDPGRVEPPRIEPSRDEPARAETARAEAPRAATTRSEVAGGKEPTVAITGAVAASAPDAVKLAVARETNPKDAKRAPEPNRPQHPARATTPAPLSFNSYEEILGYALFPQDYAARFWARGYGDVIAALVTPATVAASTADNSKDRRARGGRNDAGDTGTAGMCAADAEEQANKTIVRLGEILELNDAQRDRLRELRAALAEAVKRGKAACVTTLPPTPAGRLKVATDGLWVMRDTNVLFRTPLAAFHATLSSAQKAQWQKLASAPDNSDATQNGPIGCSTGGNGLPVDAIEQSVRPTPDQRAGLGVLRQVSSDMAGYLAGSCPETLPVDPVARLDAVGNRVNALLYAVMLFDQALTGFYIQLSSEQKDTFDKVGGRY